MSLAMYIGTIYYIHIAIIYILPLYTYCHYIHIVLIYIFLLYTYLPLYTYCHYIHIVIIYIFAIMYILPYYIHIVIVITGFSGDSGLPCAFLLWYTANQWLSVAMHQCDVSEPIYSSTQYLWEVLDFPIWRNGLRYDQYNYVNRLSTLCYSFVMCMQSLYLCVVSLTLPNQ